MLIATGLYGLWLLSEVYTRRPFSSRNLIVPAVVLATGFGLGFLLSAPQTLPTAEYLGFSHRLDRRQGGFVETKGVGIRALPQFVLADCYGSERRGNAYLLTQSNRLEGAAGGYTGFVAALFLAPLALTNWRGRREILFWFAVAVLAAGQVLDIPILRTIYQSYPLSALRNNRLVFLTAWSLLTLAVVGFDQLARGEVDWSPWYWLPIAACVICGLGFTKQALDPPKLLDFAVAEAATANFISVQVVGALLSGVVLVLWGAIARRWIYSALRLACLAIVMLGELTWSAYGFNPQVDPNLDYPELPIIRQLQDAPSGRVCGVGCLFVNLNMVFELPEIRGYDAVDPTYYVELIDCFRSNFPQAVPNPAAVTSLLIPHQSPILDMLNLRYQVYRGSPPSGTAPLLQGDGYCVYENKNCLPRVFVPSRVVVVPDKEQRLRLLSRVDFNPRDVAYIEDRVLLSEPAQGTGRIVQEEPNAVTIRLSMNTPGCVVLSDLWYPGWKAYVDGREQAVLRVNHALRGVLVGRGEHALTFRFEPSSFSRGIWLAAAGGMACLVWTVVSAVVSKLRARGTLTPPRANP